MQPTPTKREVIPPATIIKDLGDFTSDEMAAFLAREGMDGARYSASHDPVALFVLIRSRYSHGAIGPERWCFSSFIDERTNTWTHADGDTPPTIAEFQRRFDAGEFPRLISTARESPDWIGSKWLDGRRHQK